MKYIIFIGLLGLVLNSAQSQMRVFVYEDELIKATLKIPNNENLRRNLQIGIEPKGWQVMKRVPHILGQLTINGVRIANIHQSQWRYVSSDGKVYFPGLIGKVRMVPGSEILSIKARWKILDANGTSRTGKIRFGDLNYTPPPPYPVGYKDGCKGRGNEFGIATVRISDLDAKLSPDPKNENRPQLEAKAKVQVTASLQTSQEDFVSNCLRGSQVLFQLLNVFTGSLANVPDWGRIYVDNCKREWEIAGCNRTIPVEQCTCYIPQRVETTESCTQKYNNYSASLLDPLRNKSLCMFRGGFALALMGVYQQSLEKLGISMQDKRQHLGGCPSNEVQNHGFIFSSRYIDFEELNELGVNELKVAIRGVGEPRQVDSNWNPIACTNSVPELLTTNIPLQ